MENMRQEKPSAKVIRFPQDKRGKVSSISYLYCQECGALVGVYDETTEKIILDGKFCRECGRAITDKTVVEKK